LILNFLGKAFLLKVRENFSAKTKSEENAKVIISLLGSNFFKPIGQCRI